MGIERCQSEAHNLIDIVGSHRLCTHHSDTPPSPTVARMVENVALRELPDLSRLAERLAQPKQKARQLLHAAQKIPDVCINKNPKPPKPLDHYSFPRFLRNMAQSTNVLLKGNTIFPGDRKSGGVIFSGRCNDYEMHVALILSSRHVSFQFPSAR